MSVPTEMDKKALRLDRQGEISDLSPLRLGGDGSVLFPSMGGCSDPTERRTTAGLCVYNIDAWCSHTVTVDHVIIQSSFRPSRCCGSHSPWRRFKRRTSCFCISPQICIQAHLTGCQPGLQDVMLAVNEQKADDCLFVLFGFQLSRFISTAWICLVAKPLSSSNMS